jgi:hypothetical protein
MFGVRIAWDAAALDLVPSTEFVGAMVCLDAGITHPVFYSRGLGFSGRCSDAWFFHG